MQLKVIRPTEVQVYSCDNTGNCDSTCDERNGYDGSGCLWIRFEDFTQLTTYGTGKSQFSEPTRLWFCSYECLADWSMTKAAETGEILPINALAAA